MNKHITYAASKGKPWFVVVDGAEGNPYDEMFKSSWDDSGVWRPRVMFDSPDGFHYVAQKGNSMYLVEETIT